MITYVIIYFPHLNKNSVLGQIINNVKEAWMVFSIVYLKGANNGTFTKPTLCRPPFFHLSFRLFVCILKQGYIISAADCIAVS